MEHSKLLNQILFYIRICYPVLFWGFTAKSQNNIPDSLNNLLNNQKEDLMKVNSLIELSNFFRYSNTDTALLFANTALDLAYKLDYNPGIADSKKMLSALHASQGKFNEGLEFGFAALEIYNSLYSAAPKALKKHISVKIADTYQNLGHNSTSQGNIAEGLKYNLLSLHLKEQLGDKKGASDTYYNLGLLNVEQKDYAGALKNFQSSLKISQELNFNSDMALCYNAMATVYINLGLYSEASKQCSTALLLAEMDKDKFSLAEIYNNLGNLNYFQENYSAALKNNFHALSLYEETGIYQQVPFIYNNIGLVYLKEINYYESERYLNMALTLAKKMNSFELLKISYANLFLMDSTRGNYKNAFLNFSLFVKYRDSLSNIENTKKMVQQQMQYDFNKKEDSTRVVQEIKEALALTEINSHKITRNFSLVGLVGVVFFSIYSFYRYRVEKKLQIHQSLLNERLRISSDLHDEVGSTLSGIAMYSHLTKEQVKAGQTQEMVKSLNIMQESSAQMVDKLNDIVWFINPEQDSIQKLLERLEDYARKMAAIKNITVKLDFQPVYSSEILTTESRRNTYLLCKEAINNAVKYSHATRIELSVIEKNGLVEFAIMDNGKGFDKNQVRLGNGLKNMQKRADEISARLVLKSKENEGTSIVLQCKID